jgi:hypothetical protein
MWSVNSTMSYNLLKNISLKTIIVLICAIRIILNFLITRRAKIIPITLLRLGAGPVAQINRG